MSQNPGFGQNNGQPATASGLGQRPPEPEHEFVPPARPAANYRGFNAYHCCGTVIQGAHNVTKAEIMLCTNEICFSIWMIIEYYHTEVIMRIKSVFIGHMIFLGLAVLNLVLSFFAIKTLSVTGCRGACAPIALTVVNCLRILLYIYLVIIGALLLAGSTKFDPATIEYSHSILVLTIVVSVFGILVYSYFIAVMTGLILFQLASSNEADEGDIGPPIIDYNPDANATPNPNSEVE